MALASLGSLWRASANQRSNSSNGSSYRTDSTAPSLLISSRSRPCHGPAEPQAIIAEHGVFSVAFAAICRGSENLAIRNPGVRLLIWRLDSLGSSGEIVCRKGASRADCTPLAWTNFTCSDSHLGDAEGPSREPMART